MLLMGAALGTLWAHAVTAVTGTGAVHVGGYALVGMAATTAGASMPFDGRRADF
jgi:H+/Cl- antiporter ClcA